MVIIVAKGNLINSLTEKNQNHTKYKICWRKGIVYE
jgi:hypothetical protein